MLDKNSLDAEIGDSGLIESDWKATAKKLLKQLETHQHQAEKYEDALKRIIATHQIDSEEVERLKREVELRDNDIGFLWQEIEALQHGYAQLDAMRQHRQKEIGQLRQQQDNSNLKIDYLESVIERQSKIISKLETEIVLRAEHAESLKKTPGWKLGKTISGKELGAPIDLSSVPELPSEVIEPEYSIVPKLEPAPRSSDFERTFKKDETIASGYHAVLESPRSFASPAIGQTVRFVGWCLDEKGRAPVRMWTEVGEKEGPVALGSIRSDVVERFNGNMETELRCGFAAEVSTGPGENFITLHAEFSDGSKALLFKRIVVNLGFETTPKRQLDEDYQSWIQSFDSMSEADVKTQIEAARSFEYRPLISILLPVYNTEESLLREVIESVMGQTYDKWQLCIADDRSPSPHVRTILDEYVQKDDRIKVVYRTENGHISAASNSALSIAEGEYCALLDHDDLLPVHAFYNVAKALNEFPETDLIFSDEDKIDADGKRFDPYFKSDWNPDLFLSHNCISHLGVYRTCILKEIDGFKEDLYGSQDWDMALRFIQKISQDRILHIPKILYHWRYLDSSTSKTINSKPYAVTAGKRAIEQYLTATGKNAVVEEAMWPGAYRVRYELPADSKVSIIIPTRNQKDVTKQCVDSVLNLTNGVEFEIILVDNQSDEPEALKWFEEISKKGNIRVLRYDHPFNYSAINNFAAKEATGNVLVLLNNDVEVVEPDWLKELASQALREEVGVAGAWLLYPDHTVQHSGILMGVCGIAVEAFKHQLEWNIGHMGRAHLNQYYSAVTGACMAIRKDVFDRLNGLNEEELAVAYNDVDLCLRAKRDLGLATVWTPYAKLIHHESISRGYEVTEEQKQRIQRESDYMIQNWSELIERDPYYNPNLSKYDTRFSLAWPPRQG